MIKGHLDYVLNSRLSVNHICLRYTVTPTLGQSMTTTL